MRAIGWIVLSLCLVVGCTAPQSVKDGYSEMLALEAEIARSELELIAALPQTPEVERLADMVGQKHGRFVELGGAVGRFLRIPGIEAELEGFLLEIDVLVEKIHAR